MKKVVFHRCHLHQFLLHSQHWLVVVWTRRWPDSDRIAWWELMFMRVHWLYLTDFTIHSIGLLLMLNVCPIFFWIFTWLTSHIRLCKILRHNTKAIFCQPGHKRNLPGVHYPQSFATSFPTLLGQKWVLFFKITLFIWCHPGYVSMY